MYTAAHLNHGDTHCYPRLHTTSLQPYPLASNITLASRSGFSSSHQILDSCGGELPETLANVHPFLPLVEDCSLWSAFSSNATLTARLRDGNL